jgi:hypothetical protein
MADEKTHKRKWEEEEGEEEAVEKKESKNARRKRKRIEEKKEKKEKKKEEEEDEEIFLNPIQEDDINDTKQRRNLIDEPLKILSGLEDGSITLYHRDNGLLIFAPDDVVQRVKDDIRNQIRETEDASNLCAKTRGSLSKEVRKLRRHPEKFEKDDCVICGRASKVTCQCGYMKYCSSNCRTKHFNSKRHTCF